MASTAANTTTCHSTTRVLRQFHEFQVQGRHQGDATVFDTGINNMALARLTSCDIYVVRPQESTVSRSARRHSSNHGSNSLSYIQSVSTYWMPTVVFCNCRDKNGH